MWVIVPVGGFVPMCFPAQATVTTPAGAKTMSALNIGDDVRVVTDQNQLGWSKVIGWLHREPTSTAPYLKISTATRQLYVSEDHLVGTVQEGRVAYVQARTVQPGTTLFECDATPSGTGVWSNTVQRVERVAMQGVYAPLTMEGTIVVDGVGASCYAATHSHKAAHATMKPMRHMYRHNPAKMQQQTHVGKRITGSHKYVDVLARVAGKV